MEIISQLAAELHQKQAYVENVVNLLDEGNTIPFIARYRKELHGSMDDTTLRELETRLEYLRGLDERRKTIEKAVAVCPEADGGLPIPRAPSELQSNRRVVNDQGVDVTAEYERGAALALAACRANDIAEEISDNAELRKVLRRLLHENGSLHSEAATEDDSVYALYYDFSQAISKLQGYQILAINRGEKEKLLKVSLVLNEMPAMQAVRRAAVRFGSPATEFVQAAAQDAYDRLIFPSLEREQRAALTDAACEGAIGQFALNLRPLLMQPPVKGKVTMGLDPGYRMGCKVAVVDATGKVLDTTVVYPTYGERQKQEAITALSRLVRKDGVEHIAIGNGTASRETEQMAVELIRKEKEAGRTLSYMIVSEAGASVYSASKLAAEEFPQFDVNLRSAVSIARRLQDPLAELVKIEPKAIGVGQYQHDMPQKQLEAALDGVVEDCVNAVGVDLAAIKPAINPP